MSLAIETRNLTKTFSSGRRGLHLFRRATERTAVDGVTLEVKEGEVFGLLGPNGAGKTTLIKMLCTLITPSCGRAAVCGKDVVDAGRAVREMIGLVASDERSFYWRLTGRQNLRFFAALYQLSGKQADLRIAKTAEAVDLRDALDQRFDSYSTGMRQRLAIARGLLKEPRILFMDEPTKGVDPVNAQALLSFIRERIAGAFGKTILLTTHILSEAEKVCDRVAILNDGKLLACETVAQIRESTRTEEKYLLQVEGVGELFLEGLGKLAGMIASAIRGREQGSLFFEILIDRESNVFPELIDRIVRGGGRVLRCASEEISFEEVVRSLFKKGLEVRCG